MANVFWNVTTSGNWTTAADWNTDTVPGSGDDAVLGVTGFAISDDGHVPVDGALTFNGRYLISTNQSII